MCYTACTVWCPALAVLCGVLLRVYSVVHYTSYRECTVSAFIDSWSMWSTESYLQGTEWLRLTDGIKRLLLFSFHDSGNVESEVARSCAAFGVIYCRFLAVRSNQSAKKSSFFMLISDLLEASPAGKLFFLLLSCWKTQPPSSYLLSWPIFWKRSFRGSQGRNPILMQKLIAGENTQTEINVVQDSLEDTDEWHVYAHALHT